jgi:hypothetical protein
MANVWVCKEAFEIFRAGCLAPQSLITDAPEASRSACSDTPPATTEAPEVSSVEASTPLSAPANRFLNSWIESLPDPSHFPFVINRRTKLLTIPTIIKGPQDAYDIPTGCGVLIRLTQDGTETVADPKMLIRRHVRFFPIILHSAANDSAAADSVLPDRQRGDTL